MQDNLEGKVIHGLGLVLSLSHILNESMSGVLYEPGNCTSTEPSRYCSVMPRLLECDYSKVINRRMLNWNPPK